MQMAFLVDNLQYYLQVGNLKDIFDCVLAILECLSFSWEFCVCYFEYFQKSWSRLRFKLNRLNGQHFIYQKNA